MEIKITDIFDIDIHFNFKVRDSEMYGGEGSIGYVSTSLCHCGAFEKATDPEQYMSAMESYRKNMANVLGVPIEKLFPISYQQYKEETEDETQDNNDACNPEEGFGDAD